MFFIEWWIVRRVCIGLLMVAVATISFWSVRNHARPVRLTVQFISTIVGLCGALGLWIMWWAVASGHVYSVPIYSSNQKMAVRVDRYNPGEIGGPTYDSVQLFSAHGFNSDVVFSGPWGSLKRPKIQWRSDSELEIYYEGTTGVCTNALHVSVRCIRQ